MLVCWNFIIIIELIYYNNNNGNIDRIWGQNCYFMIQSVVVNDKIIDILFFLYEVLV